MLYYSLSKHRRKGQQVVCKICVQVGDVDNIYSKDVLTMLMAPPLDSSVPRNTEPWNQFKRVRGVYYLNPYHWRINHGQPHRCDNVEVHGRVRWRFNLPVVLKRLHDRLNNAVIRLGAR